MTPDAATTSPPSFGASLNDAQRAAAVYADGGRGEGEGVGEGVGVGVGVGVASGPLLVIAGAGTGKTNTLAHRVAYLLLQRVAPQRIALMTFSRRASLEMMKRAELIATQALREQKHKGRAVLQATAATRMMWSGTFHSIGNRLLREYAHSLGLEASFSVIDRGDSADLIDVQRQRLGLSSKGKRFPRKDTCLSIYSHRVNTGNKLQDTLEQAFPWCAEWADDLTRLFRAYVEAKQSQQLLDYDDLLLYWDLLMQEPALAQDVGARFDHVLVDEYQDTNALQARILLALKPQGNGLCVVGDDAQSIYSFRAATVDNILGFPDQFSPPAKVITLDQNYRSVQPILDSANTLMGEGTSGFEKNLHSTHQSDQKPWYVTVEDDRAQASYVVEQILARREEGTPLRQQAVLMRKSHDSDVLEVELVQRDIPYVKYGGLKFLEAAHVKDVLAMLRFIDNPKNRLAGFRCLQLLPGIGPASAERCLDEFEADGYSPTTLAAFTAPAQAAPDWRTFSELFIDLHARAEWPGQLTDIRKWYEPHLERLHGSAHVRLADLEQLEALSVEHQSRERFLTELTLDPPNATGDDAGAPHQDEDYLILSTVHSAKGQEWNSVYLLNVVDGTFPNEFATKDPKLVEEERRLLYVGMTRAKQDLHLVAPLRFYVTQQRKFGEKHLYGARSRFLTEPVLASFESKSWPGGSAHSAAVAATTKVRVDVGSKLLSMWDDD